MPTPGTPLDPALRQAFRTMLDDYAERKISAEDAVKAELAALNRALRQRYEDAAPAPEARL